MEKGCARTVLVKHANTGNPATLVRSSAYRRSEALRPRLSTGLPKLKNQVTPQQLYKEKLINKSEKTLHVANKNVTTAIFLLLKSTTYHFTTPLFNDLQNKVSCNASSAKMRTEQRLFFYSRSASVFTCAITLRPNADRLYPPSRQLTMRPFAYSEAISITFRVIHA